MRKEKNTPVFESRKPQPEQSPTPEKKDLSPLLKQFEELNGLAENGCVDEMTRENFPDIAPDALQENRYIGYSTKILLLMNIAGTTENTDIKDSLQTEIDTLTQTRDEEFIKNHSKIVKSPLSTDSPTEDGPHILQPRKPDPNERTGLYL